MPQYLSPTGCEIQGVPVTVPGVSLIDGITSDGKPIWSGWTDYDTNFMENEFTDDGEFVFIDTDGVRWTFDQLVLAPDEDDELQEDDYDDRHTGTD